GGEVAQLSDTRKQREVVQRQAGEIRGGGHRAILARALVFAPVPAVQPAQNDYRRTAVSEPVLAA
ncbi:MAG TPA: hypothetical protein VEZ89_01855, partial [Rubrivivax sp.]|nr:hypothetical protein [Rubrivivax sp.]